MISASLAISVIALLVSVWALYWRRRAGAAAERSANESARSAAAAEKSARTAAEGLIFSKQQAQEEAKLQRGAWLDTLVREGIDKWDQLGQLDHIVGSHPSLTDDEVRVLVYGVFGGRGKSNAEAERYLKDVLNEREKRTKTA